MPSKPWPQDPQDLRHSRLTREYLVKALSHAPDTMKEAIGILIESIEEHINVQLLAQRFPGREKKEEEP